MHHHQPTRFGSRSNRRSYADRRVALENIGSDFFLDFTSRSREIAKRNASVMFHRVLRLCKLDRIALWEFTKDRDELVWLYQRRSADAPLIASRTEATDVQWARAALLRAETAVMGNDDKPHAAAHRTINTEVDGAGFWLALPLRRRGVVFGGLILAATSKRINLDLQLIAPLQRIADVFACVLSQARTEEALGQSELLRNSILGSIDSDLAVLRRDATIVAATRGWEASAANGSNIDDLVHGAKPGSNYLNFLLDEKRVASSPELLRGLRDVLTHSTDKFDYEYTTQSALEGQRHLRLTLTTLGRFAGGALITRVDTNGSKRGHSELLSSTETGKRSYVAGVAGKLLRAQEEERSRIARELHDDFAQRLALLTIQLQEFESSLPNGDHRSRVSALAAQVSELSMDVAQLSHRLHSSYLDTFGLPSAVKSLCAEISRAHRIDIRCEIDNCPTDLDKDIVLALFPVIREALHNIVKHSHATKVEVVLWSNGDYFRLTITDNGIGFEPETEATTTGLGLISMKERLNLVGGGLLIESDPLQGTRIEATVPLAAKTRHAGAGAGAPMINSLLCK